VQFYFEFPFCDSHYSSVVQDPDLVHSVRGIVASSTVSPFQLSEQGTGGTYFVLDSEGNRVAVFKPADEEPGSRNNPKEIVSNPLMEPGGGAVREVLAYLLDRDHVAGVPETHLVEDLCHSHWTDFEKRQVPKSGSLQKYVPNFSAAADVGSSLFSVDDVHNVGIFDLRLMNLDRNGENLLAVKDGKNHRLVPIDHSYILPPKIQKPFFEWLYWKQAKEPFSSASLKYIADLDVDRDAAILAEHGLTQEPIKIMKISTIFLKHCAAAGMTLFQIGCLVASEDVSGKSVLESIVDEAGRLSDSNSDADGLDFYEKFLRLIYSFITKSFRKSQ